MGCKYCYIEEDEQKNEISSKIKNLESNGLFDTTSDANDDSYINNIRELIKKGIDINKGILAYEIVNEINKYRENHCVPNIQIDENINKISQKYAEKLARESELESSENKYKGKNLGEIVFLAKEEISPKELVEMWYKNGSKDYNYKQECKEPNNFTQIIWKKSRLIGIGYAKTKEDFTYIVVNFFPTGNVKGEYIKNVLPPKIKSSEISFYSVTSSFLEDALNIHNELRAKHKSPPLTLNPALSTLAQRHAKLMADQDSMTYSGNHYKNQKCGENLYCKEDGKEISGEEMTLSWYNEIQKYDFRNEKNNKYDEVGDFTQLVWKSTQEVGFGFAKSDSGSIYAVANYYPSGNIKGSYYKNVLIK